MKKRILIPGILSILVLFMWEGHLRELDESVQEKNYKGREGMDRNTFAARLLGMKKAARSGIWMEHVVATGGLLGGDSEIAIEALKKGSERISYLDPYFTRNYTFTGGILAFIRTYKDFDGAFHILQRGVENNPQNDMLKKYLAGVAAANKGNSDDLLKLLEEIVQNTRDDLLLNALAFSYEKMYNETGQEKYLKKSMKYWGQLLDSPNDMYRVRAGERIKNYVEEY